VRIAVVGGGISGNLAARLIAQRHCVTLLEANDYPGGHAQTVDVSTDEGDYAVDTGFMVFNERTYPNFVRMLRWVDCPWQESDMSFSVRVQRTGLEYNGGSLSGLFAQRKNLFNLSFWKMLADIAKFNRVGTRFTTSDQDDVSVGQFLGQHRLTGDFLEHYLRPMAAAIWSARPETITEFPTSFMLEFFRNHGLMQVQDRPLWQTVINGSRAYVEKLLSPLGDQVRLSCRVQSIVRTDDHVVLEWLEKGQPKTEVFDQVVLAVHADQALRLLKDSSPVEQEVLSAFPYQANEAVLHTDRNMLPQTKRAQASWNYHLADNDQGDVSVTYDLKRLQRLGSTRPILVTLNRTEEIDPAQVLRTIQYHHPAFNARSPIAQQRWSEISGVGRTHFAGAYWGYGFHEDGVNSALAVAKHLGVAEFPPAQRQASFSVDHADPTAKES